MSRGQGAGVPRPQESESLPEMRHPWQDKRWLQLTPLKEWRGEEEDGGGEGRRKRGRREGGEHGVEGWREQGRECAWGDVREERGSGRM